jgi:hypothetical protein
MKLRWVLIKWLAHKDPIALNLTVREGIVVIPSYQSGFICNCHFIRSSKPLGFWARIWKAVREWLS